MIDINRLIQMYSNEKSSQTLLNYDSYFQECSDILKAYEIATDKSDVVKTLYEIEYERIKYFIKEYILTRLDKIRHNLFLDTEQMSESEKLFYENYKLIAIKNGFFVDQPSKTYEVVGFIANENLDNVKIDNEIVEIFKGDFFVASLEEVRHLLDKNKISLV